MILLDSSDWLWLCRDLSSQRLADPQLSTRLNAISMNWWPVVSYDPTPEISLPYSGYQHRTFWETNTRILNIAQRISF
jgi:hypothetical protein